VHVLVPLVFELDEQATNSTTPAKARRKLKARTLLNVPEADLLGTSA
jgi:hypothetical protein